MPPYTYSQPPRRFVDTQDQSMLPQTDVPRSTFVGRKTIMAPLDAGKLYPLIVDEVLPGDHTKWRVDFFARIATLLFPVMSNQRVIIEAFFTPCRLLWTHWEQFIAGSQPTGPAESVNYTVPYVASPTNGFPVGSIWDMMGIGAIVGQVTTGRTKRVNALPARAHNLIHREWYRSQSIQNALTISTGDGPDNENLYALQYRCKPHDYFTDCLPQPQKFTAPTIPLGSLAPIQGLLVRSTDTPANTSALTLRDTKQLYTAGAIPRAYPQDPTTNQLFAKAADAGGAGAAVEVYADLSAASAININVLRQAWAIQGALERDARYGTRYTEYLQGHWRVTSPDARLQRPELLGQHRRPLVVTPIAQTAPDTAAPVGTLGGVGVAEGPASFSYAATEHGYVHIFFSIQTEQQYSQGVHRLWTRETKYDFALPDLAGIGEQAVRRDEIYTVGGPTDPEDTTVFGYMPRYEEYRRLTSDVRGVFRPRAANAIDEWHTGANFGTPPTLSDTFIKDTPPMQRVLAAGAQADGQQYLCQILLERETTRALPLHGIPSQLGRL